MEILQKNTGRRPLGVWLAIIALLLLLVIGFGGQAYSLMDWDGAVDMGLQNDRFSGDSVERTLAKVEKGVCIADMIWPLPILLLALFGLFKRKFYGFAAGLMGLSIGGYFPLFFLFQRWDTHLETVILALCLFALPSYLGIIGLWSNREFFMKAKENHAAEKE
ncbi:MAG: hypothetical protein GY765_30645 [bacterium]|nr:hypothetical protein [bacterium]